MSEAIRMCEFFPPIVRLLEFGQAAPVMDSARLVAPECPLCEGTGFEPFERGGYAFVQFCPRGCKPGMAPERPDYRTDEEAKAEAKAGLLEVEKALRARGVEVRPAVKVIA